MRCTWLPRPSSRHLQCLSSKMDVNYKFQLKSRTCFSRLRISGFISYQFASARNLKLLCEIILISLSIQLYAFGSNAQVPARVRTACSYCVCSCAKVENIKICLSDASNTRAEKLDPDRHAVTSK